VTPHPPFRYYPVPGPAYPFYALELLALVSYGILELILNFRSSHGLRKNQIAYVLSASIIGFGGGGLAFLPVFGIPVYPLWQFTMPIYIFMAIYAIVKYRLLDITIVIRKGLLYSTLTLLFTGVYLTAILAFREIFQSLTGYNSLLINALLILMFVALFQPLKDKVQSWIDQIFFKGKYDYQKTLKSLSQAVVSIIDLKELQRLVLETVSEAMKLSYAAVYFYDRRSKQFVSENSGKLNLTDPLIQLLIQRKEPIYGEVRPEIQGDLIIPMLAKERVIGFLSLGDKRSGDTFSDEDLNLLMTLANQMAVVVENSALYEELSQADKLSALGVITAGMAHEIKNPLASIKGLTQVLPENLSDSEFLKTYLEIVPRQLDRINNILSDLITFGRPAKLVFAPVNVHLILEKILKLLENACQEVKIQVIKEYGILPEIQADQEKLTQAFLNVVLNALEAMPEGGKLKIKTFSLNSQAVVEIADTGVGIPEENLRNIFDPFYSTKGKGSGLGLSTTYRIIKEHQGSIEVKSKVGEGATFSIYLGT